VTSRSKMHFRATIVLAPFLENGIGAGSSCANYWYCSLGHKFPKLEGMY
jgi:hypothetical protein